MAVTPIQLTQTKADREALYAEWKAHPRVVAFHAAALAYAQEYQLLFDIDGINEMFRFSNQWFIDNGILPDSGVQIG